MSEIKLLDRYGKPMASSYEGAGHGTAGQLRDWHPQARTADAAILPTLAEGNARADDIVRNNAFGANAVQLHVDNIVGHLFRLSYKPNSRRLGINEDDARDFAKDVEQVWKEISDDPNCYLDAERKRTFTMMIREGVATHTRCGEIMQNPLWIDRKDSPVKTAFQMINPMQVSNPNGMDDTDRIKGGIEQDKYGAAIAAHVQVSSSMGVGNGLGWTWQRIPTQTPWGRTGFIQIFEPSAAGQTRGANQFLTVLEQMKILPKMQNIKLQNAAVGAMFAATIESALSPEDAFEALGGSADSQTLQNILSRVQDYHSEVGLKLGGVTIPHLLPNEQLKLHTSGNVDNGYTDLESSVLRWGAAGLNVAYEPFSKDWKNTSYSTIRASILENWRYFMGRRKMIAARLATIMFRLVFEEFVHRKLITLPKGARFGLYDGGLAAWTNCEWIGTGRIAIDGLKEVKEAVLRIESGLSSYEKEFAIMGEDYQETFAQQVREMKERKEAGLPSASWAAAEKFAPAEPQEITPQKVGA
ncbi:phage portal protein [Marinomonas spartinae]|uniref:phage portal protein n=1 Tax=Marinomonas spartinae TaxID=1792290 RepID=UPI001F3F5BFA|nr:phage portal protein [Marinomonas spartinae]